MRLIIAGSRHCPVSIADIAGALNAAALPQRPRLIIHGGCPTGADAAAALYAEALGIEVQVFPADWRRHGKAAGPIRNAEMARFGQALLAFWDGKSTGTQGMIALAGAAGLRFHVVRVEPPPSQEAWPRARRRRHVGFRP